MSTINEEKLNAAREKLACHILPPGQHADPSGGGNEQAASVTGTESSMSQGSSCSIAGAGQPGTQKVRLTEMTSAGG